MCTWGSTITRQIYLVHAHQSIITQAYPLTKPNWGKQSLAKRETQFVHKAVDNEYQLGKQYWSLCVSRIDKTMDKNYGVTLLIFVCPFKTFDIFGHFGL